VERVSGQSFDEYVHEHIFAPLGMEHTALNATLSDNEWVAKKRAEQRYYTIENELLGNNMYFLSLYPAGMATGTLSDFVKFGQALLPDDGKKSPLFGKMETLNDMLSPSLFFADGVTARNDHGFWTDEFSVPVLWHNGGTLGSTSWFAFDPKSDIGMVIFVNQYHEAIYTCGLLPKVFGTYKGGTGAAQAEDISGIYMSARTFYEGFAKPYSLFSNMQFVKDGEGRYSVPGFGFTVTAVGADSYLLDRDGLKQDIMYASNSEEGRKILHLPGVDYVETNGYEVISQLMLLGLFVLAALYGLFSLMIRFITYLKHNMAPQIMGKYRDIVHASIVITAMLCVYTAAKLFSNTPLLKDIQWSIMLIAVLFMIPVAYVIILATRWVKLDCTKKEKIKLVVTGVAGLIMTWNVVFWETYKFW
jgi:hypothetical protein